MATVIEPLILDFLEWVAAKPRPYRDVMDAWRTSCPRLTVWEDSIDAGYVARIESGRKPQGPLIGLTPLGLNFLESSGRIRRGSAH